MQSQRIEASSGSATDPRRQGEVLALTKSCPRGSGIERCHETSVIGDRYLSVSEYGQKGCHGSHFWVRIIFSWAKELPFRPEYLKRRRELHRGKGLLSKGAPREERALPFQGGQDKREEGHKGERG